MAEETYDQRLARLDPHTDHQEMVRICSSYLFPWDTERALELALFRTFAVSSIGELLAKSGAFAKNTQRRYDSTAILVAEFSYYGYDSERGKQALRRMNQIHGRFEISNQDFLYVLSTFVCEPVRWMQRYAWRGYDEREIYAAHQFWYQIGLRMGLKDIPHDYAALDSFNQEYEATYFAFSEGGKEVADHTMELLLSWYLPKPIRAWGRPASYALMDAPLREAFGYPEAPLKLRSTIHKLLHRRSKWERSYRKRSQKEAKVVDQRLWNSYPKDYSIEAVGSDLEN